MLRLTKLQIPMIIRFLNKPLNIIFDKARKLLELRGHAGPAIFYEDLYKDLNDFLCDNLGKDRVNEIMMKDSI